MSKATGNVWLIRRILLLMLLGLLARTASAEMPLSIYNQFKDEKEITNYVTGVGQGIVYANAYTGTTGRTKLFCFPGQLDLSEGLILSILEQGIRVAPERTIYGEEPTIEMILLFSFIDTFPCTDPR